MTVGKNTALYQIKFKKQGYRFRAIYVVLGSTITHSF